jgi:hypothetical protein
MSDQNFRDWLVAVVPRFPRFSDLAAAVRADVNWPEGHEKSKLRSRLRTLGYDNLTPALVEALEAFNLLCIPTTPNAGLPWEWHTALLVEQTKASAERHRRNRSIPTEEYRLQLGQRLAAEMAVKTRIYVDTCHWVKMRDFERGRNVPPAYGEILTRLRHLVSTGRYICPLSPPLFTELQTQSDLSTRAHTARLMEELSQNVGMPHLSEMEELELRRMTLDRCFGVGGLNIDWQLWRKGSLLIVERWPSSSWMSEEENWYIQKTVLDAMWEAPFTQLVSVMPELFDTRDMREKFAANLNADREARPSTDFELERQRAVAMIVREFLIPHMPSLFKEVQWLASRRPGFQYPTEEFAPDPRILPSVQVLSGIEALIRTSGRRFRPNDMFDLFHCAAAIPYCQVFLCDTAFKNIVTDAKLGYPEKYGVKVLASPDEIAIFLSGQS